MVKRLKILDTVVIVIEIAVCASLWIIKRSDIIYFTRAKVSDDSKSARNCDRKTLSDSAGMKKTIYPYKWLNGMNFS